MSKVSDRRKNLDGLTQFISLPDLAGREFNRFHRYGEGMLQLANLIDAGGL
jgi:hypothetical protein